MAKYTLIIRISLLATMVLLGGCATTSSSDVNDPFESYNRVMHSINTSLDKIIIKPIAEGYHAVLPHLIQKGVSNVFSNLNEITVILNDLLQFKCDQAFDDLGYFLLNSTVGVAGLFDVAGHAGHTKHNEDFGQTLAVWGVETGPYFVLPIFGPSTLRDSIGKFADSVFTDPIAYIDHIPTRNQVYGTKVIDTRANLLSVGKVLNEATDDTYAFTRDAYLQYRLNLVYDGDPPLEYFDVFSD